MTDTTKETVSIMMSSIVESTNIEDIKKAIKTIETIKETENLKEDEVNMLIWLKRNIINNAHNHRYAESSAGIQICINNAKKNELMYENYLNAL